MQPPCIAVDTITAGNQHIEQDGCIRPGTDAKTLADLKPAFEEKGTVTAGTSSIIMTGDICST